MTNRELNRFFSMVKGKRIRWTGWNTNEFFVPTGLWKGATGIPYVEGADGIVIICNDLPEEEIIHYDSEAAYLVMEGFNPSTNGFKWEMFTLSPSLNKYILFGGEEK